MERLDRFHAGEIYGMDGAVYSLGTPFNPRLKLSTRRFEGGRFVDGETLAKRSR